MDHHLLDPLTKLVVQDEDQDQELQDPVNGSQYDDGFDFLSPYQQSLDLGNFPPFCNVSSELEFVDDQENYPMINYINQILMEEKLIEHPSVDFDPTALQAAEKSFYQVLAKNFDPSLPHQPSVDLHSSSNSTSVKNPTTVSNVIASVDSEIYDYRSTNAPFSSNSTSVKNATTVNNVIASVDTESYHCRAINATFRLNSTSFKNATTVSNVIASVDSESYNYRAINATFNASPNGYVTCNPDLGVQNHDFDLANKSVSKHSGKSETLLDSELISTMFADAETMLQFKRGLEEGNKFLPNGNQVLVDIDKYALPSISKDVKHVAKSGKSRRIGRKHNYLENYDDFNPQRNSKHSAVYQEEADELSETFDRVLLYGDSEVLVSSFNAADKTLQKNGLVHRIYDEKGRNKKAGNDTGAIDLVTLLLSCAQSISVDDSMTAIEQLNQIRHHASSDGDQYQRLSVIFANALEARLTGAGQDLYAGHISKRVSAAEELKAMRVYLCAPIKQMSSFLANRMIMDAASNSKTLHIVDFGISYGFHWPSFIQLLSKRPGGPPKLRITGIDTPQTGFRPAEKLEDTGRRLAKYSERFDVPFEYKALAIQNWETIKIEELNLSRSEVVAVNCPFALMNLLDETTGNESPRDSVLSLIREMKPDILTNCIINGPSGSSFFLPRFKEALFFFTTIFDCLDNNLPRDDLQRMKFETNFLGLEVLNIVACEGSARVERPETYKQWQARYTRAGFRILPLNPEHLRELKKKTREGYHKDFMLNEDDNWMLLGWKGKVISACSCWVPA